MKMLILGMVLNVLGLLEQTPYADHNFWYIAALISGYGIGATLEKPYAREARGNESP